MSDSGHHLYIDTAQQGAEANFSLAGRLAPLLGRDPHALAADLLQGPLLVAEHLSEEKATHFKEMLEGLGAHVTVASPEGPRAALSTLPLGVPALPRELTFEPPPATGGETLALGVRRISIPPASPSPTGDPHHPVFGATDAFESLAPPALSHAPPPSGAPALSELPIDGAPPITPNAQSILSAALLQAGPQQLDAPPASAPAASAPAAPRSKTAPAPTQGKPVMHPPVAHNQGIAFAPTVSQLPPIRPSAPQASAPLARITPRQVIRVRRSQDTPPPKPKKARPQRSLQEAHQPAVAGLLSLFLPGMGQVYNGDYERGAWYALSPFLVLPWLYSAFDAWWQARAIVAGRRYPANPRMRARIVPRQLGFNLTVFAFLIILLLVYRKHTETKAQNTVSPPQPAFHVQPPSTPQSAEAEQPAADAAVEAQVDEQAIQRDRLEALSPETLMKNARFTYEQGNYAQAHTLLTLLLDKDDNYPGAWQLMVQVKAAQAAEAAKTADAAAEAAAGAEDAGAKTDGAPPKDATP